jgi:DNA processing protein
MNRQNKLLILVINNIDFLKPRERLLLADCLTDVDELLMLSRTDIEQFIGRRLKKSVWQCGQAKKCLQKAEIIQKHLTNGNISCTFYFEREYPPQLREIYDPPLLLYYRGRLPAFDIPLVAIVGTRYPTGVARSAAYNLGRQFSALDIGVVSGLAHGIDVSAHLGSLIARGCKLAVLGNGIDMVYPVCNTKVAYKILESGGAIISEYAPGVPPFKYNFPARNRIISGLARAVIVVQAPSKSGALITADYALEQGRELYVHQIGKAGLRAQGTALLIEYGATVIENAFDVIQEWDYNMEKEDRAKQVELNSGKNTGYELARLLKLEIEERLTVHNGEYYRRG